MHFAFPLSPALLPSAAGLLAEAFFTNPAHVYICPDDRLRLAQLEWLLGGNLRIQADLQQSFCLAEGSAVHAMGFWTSSTTPPIGILPKIREGLLRAPFRLGPAGVRRLFEVTGAVDRHLAAALGARPYWYLNNMVVRESLRGTGIGSRLLTEQLERVAERAPDWAVALSTQRTENLVFYRRLGFREVSEQTVGSGARAFRNWVMVLGEAPGPRAAE